MPPAESTEDDKSTTTAEDDNDPMAAFVEEQERIEATKKSESTGRRASVESNQGKMRVFKEFIDIQIYFISQDNQQITMVPGEPPNSPA